MAIVPKSKLFKIDVQSAVSQSWEFLKSDAIQMKFRFVDGDVNTLYDDSGAEKLRVFAYATKSSMNGAYLFGAEFEKSSAKDSDGNWIANFDSQKTSLGACAAVMTVQLVDLDNNLINSSNINLLILESNSKANFSPSPEFRDECMDAKADAENAATTATTKASEAGESASAAAASADAASISAQDANGAKHTAELAKEAAGAYAADASGYAATASTKATQAITAATESMTSANLAQEVSRIAIVPITTTTQTIAPNKCYTLLTNDVDAYTLTPEMPSGNPEYLLQAVVQLKTGNTAPVINWGGNPSFFNGKIPTINANSSYDVIFEFDNITLSWSVGVMKK